jgi:hypothetical protein
MIASLRAISRFPALELIAQPARQSLHKATTR